MGKSAGELLLQRVHAVIRAAGLFEEFESAERFSLRVENEPYIPLVIESWPASVCHFTHNPAVWQRIPSKNTRQGYAFNKCAVEVQIRGSCFSSRIMISTSFRTRRSTLILQPSYTT